MPTLTIPADSAFAILLKARAYDAKTEQTAPDSGLNPGSDDSADTLEEGAGDPMRHALFSSIRALDDDEQLDLITLIWVGRGDFTYAEWAVARYAATDIGRRRTPRYVVGIPLVSDFLEEGLSMFGLSLAEFLERP
jgi:Protein of unknown function (DUF3775)